MTPSSSMTDAQELAYLGSRVAGIDEAGDDAVQA